MRPSAPPLELRPICTEERATAARGSRDTFVSPLKRLLCVGGLAISGFSLGCAPPTPAQKATDAARDLNMAARWGRMEEAMQLSSKEARNEFAQRREGWHDRVRILETELCGLDMKDATHASVKVEVSWVFADDPTLRMTKLSQEWSDEEGHWEMMSEKHLSGDKGLFGEEIKREARPRDRHFPSRTIR